MALEQKYLNTAVRQQAYMDIMMYVPDTSITVRSVSSNDKLSYSDLQSILDLDKYTSQTLATLEENLWALNGSFINPTAGVLYNGYISNSMSDDNGNFSTLPTITVNLASSSNIEYFSMVLNPAVESAYPKQVSITLNTGDVFTKTISQEKDLPNLLFTINKSGVTSLTIKFIGTQVPHRRIRLSTIMFGKLVILNQDDMVKTEYNDKNSYVCDTIPSRTFSFTMNNYDLTYNIDNPNNGAITLDKNTKIKIRNGYNIYGWDEDEQEFNNPDKFIEVEWDDWKNLRLLEIITNQDDTCTFNCGSILDMMTTNYSYDSFEPNRSVGFLVAQLLNSQGLSSSLVIFSTDDNGKSYADYEINVPLPDLPVREILQLLAFSVGASLLIKDDGTIKFANINIGDKNSFTHNHQFDYHDFATVPVAQELEHTSNISLPKYNAVVDTELSSTQVEVKAYNTEVSYGDCKPISATISEGDTSGSTITGAELYCRKGFLRVALIGNNGCKIDINGYAITTNQTQDRTITSDTLIIDTQLMKDDPNNRIKNKYKNWYKQKFKYTMQTRGEPLVDAGDWCVIQTPFSEQLDTYVLQNHIVFDGTWSGDMEVIAITEEVN